MDKQKKQDITTGNGSQNHPILAQENESTAELSQPSQASTSIALGSTKPVSVPEALSLLQTMCLDLRGMDCRVMLAAQNGRVYIVVQPPASIGAVGMKNGHITINNTEVVNL